jgi:hypothetical protein
MKPDLLHILSGETSVGTLVYDRKKDRISLDYGESWQFGSAGFPMSLSLPLAKKVHPAVSPRPASGQPGADRGMGKAIPGFATESIRCHQTCG